MLIEEMLIKNGSFWEGEFPIAILWQKASKFGLRVLLGHSGPNNDPGAEQRSMVEKWASKVKKNEKGDRHFLNWVNRNQPNL